MSESQTDMALRNHVSVPYLITVAHKLGIDPDEDGRYAWRDVWKIDYEIDKRRQRDRKRGIET